MKAIYIIILGVLCTLPVKAQTIYDLPPFERAVRIIKYFEQPHPVSMYPYVGYGHRVLKGEHFKRLPLSEREADALLRKDLRKLCGMFRYLGKDSLIAAVLAYNVGYGAVYGNKTRRKSRLLQKLERGDRNIYKEYTSFCHWNGRMILSINNRRRVELRLLYY